MVSWRMLLIVPYINNKYGMTAVHLLFLRLLSVEELYSTQKLKAEWLGD